MSSFAQKLYAFGLARYFDWLRLRHGRPLQLFFRDGGIGDIICTFPAAAALAKKNRRSYKVYCTNPAFVSLPRALGIFDHVIGIKVNDLVAATVSRRHETHRFRYPDEEPSRASQAYLADEFATGSGLRSGLPWPNFDLGPQSPRVSAIFTANSATVVCIHTGPSWAVREWPLEHWDAFVDQLRAQTGCRVIQLGASRHFLEGDRKERCVAGVKDCRDRFSLVESLQIISRSALVVGIDSGMIHGAAMLNVPVIGIFGPTFSFLRLPPRSNAVGMSADVPCLGCHHRHPRLHWRAGCPYEIRCMQGLAPEQIVTQARRLLSTIGTQA